MLYFIDCVKKDLNVYTHRKGILAFLGALLFSPGFLLLLSHRIASKLYSYNFLGKIIGKIIWRANVIFTGCHISLKATIGPGLLMPHPIAIVIGENVILGDNVVIYQSVTIGAASINRLDYPVLGSNVIIYPGCVLAGKLNIQDGVVISANSFINNEAKLLAHTSKT